MKNIISFIACTFILFTGCNKSSNDNTKDSNNSGQFSNMRKTENWVNFDDEVDVKANVIIDTLKLQEKLKKLLPSEKVLELFGPGYHNLYMGLTISKENEVEFALDPNISWWLAPGAEVPETLANDADNSSDKFASNSPYTSSVNKANINRIIFDANFKDLNKIFTAKAGELNRKKVRTIKIYEVSINVSNNGRMVKPWSIDEVDIKKFREHFYEKNVNRNYYMTGLPAISIDGFESIRRAIIYPENAYKNGVKGRVIIQLFADVNGNLAGYQLLRGLGYGCDNAVIDAIKQVKFKGYPTGQRSSIIVPFEFGLPQASSIDLAVQYFDYKQVTNAYNNISLQIINKNKTDKSINKHYFIYIYINGYCVFQTICSGISKNTAQGTYWFRWVPNKPGSYNYAIYIDPENNLNDSNRENNTVKGTLVVR